MNNNYLDETDNYDVIFIYDFCYYVKLYIFN